MHEKKFGLGLALSDSAIDARAAVMALVS